MTDLYTESSSSSESPFEITFSKQIERCLYWQDSFPVLRERKFKLSFSRGYNTHETTNSRSVYVKILQSTSSKHFNQRQAHLFQAPEN